MTTQLKRDPKTDHLLTSENAALILIDFQPAMVAGTRSVDREVLIKPTLKNAPLISIVRPHRREVSE